MNEEQAVNAEIDLIEQLLEERQYLNQLTKWLRLDPEDFDEKDTK